MKAWCSAFYISHTFFMGNRSDPPPAPPAGRGSECLRSWLSVPRAGYRSEWQIDGWEKNTNARWRRRCINTRRNINSFPVAIWPGRIPIMHIAAAVITTSSVFVTAVVIISRTLFTTEDRRRIHTADHCD